MNLGHVVGLNIPDIDTIGSRSCFMMCIVDTENQTHTVPQMQDVRHTAGSSMRNAVAEDVCLEMLLRKMKEDGKEI